MQPGPKVNTGDLQRRLFHMKQYMALAACLKKEEKFSQTVNTLQDAGTTPEDRKKEKTALRKRLNRDPRFEKLNDTTLNAIIDFTALIPQDISINEENFASEASIQTWLEKINPTELQALEDNLAKLEKKQKTADRWNKVTDAFYVAAQAVTPLTQIPILQIVMNPIMNGR